MTEQTAGTRDICGRNTVVVGVGGTRVMGWGVVDHHPSYTTNRNLIVGLHQHLL
jgi:hypothetical protein